MSIVNIFSFVRVIWPSTWQPSWICTYIFSNFLGVINWSISITFHTQLEHIILKSVTDQHLLFINKIFVNFLLRMHISSQNYWWYAVSILQQYYVEFHWNASATAYRILSTCVMWSFKCLRIIPENKKFVWKNYSGENGIQRKAILCWVIPGKI